MKRNLTLTHIRAKKRHADRVAARAANDRAREIGKARRDGEETGHSRAEAKHTEFIRAQDYNWIGPKVDQPYVVAMVHNPWPARFSPDDPYPMGLDAVGKLVRFECSVHAVQVNDQVFKYPSWGLRT